MILDSVRLFLHPEWTREHGSTGIRAGKVAAGNGEPIVVFLLGFRINRWRAVRRWLPLVLTVAGMLRDLAGDEDSGLLGYRLLLGPGPRQAMILQYWRTPGDLHRFARGDGHERARARYWWHYGAGDAVGVWHELIHSPEGRHQAVYGNMPPTGLGALRPVRPEEWQYVSSRG